MILIVFFLLIVCLLLNEVNGFNIPSNRQLIFKVIKQNDKLNHNVLPNRLIRNEFQLKSIETNADNEIINPPRPVHFGIFIVLTIYAFYISYAENSGYSGAANNDLINAIISHPYDGTVNPIYVALFNYFAIIPGIYAALLLPKAKGQKWPAAFFIYGAYALGYFLIGPYLALRDTNNSNKQGFGASIFENKIFLGLSFLFGLYLTYYGLFSDYSIDRYKEFTELFSSNTLIHVSTIDLTILNLAVWDPLREDMSRRKWTGPSALTFTLFPIFGPLAYIFLRPPLPED